MQIYFHSQIVPLDISEDKTHETGEGLLRTRISSNMNKGNVIGALYLDLQIAFDTCKPSSPTP